MSVREPERVPPLAPPRDLSPPESDVSVVVPTRDRPSALAECLAALAGQDVARIEVVVVDDGSVEPDAVEEVVRAARARLVRTDGVGPAAARNAGARLARGPVVCFTDDDCRPHPAWAGALVGRVAAGAAVVAGPTRAARPRHAPMVASQLVTNHVVRAPDRARSRGPVAFAPTSNIACRAEVGTAVPFDEGFRLAAGEDRDWCERLAAAGWEIAFEPTAVVDHDQALTVRGFWRQQVRYGRGAAQLRRGGPDRGSSSALRFALSLVVEGLRCGPRVAALVVLSQVAVAVGFVAERVTQRSRRD